MIILLVSNATHFASRISLHVRATLKSEMTWRDLPFSYVSWWDFYDDFYDRGTPDMKRVIYSLVADVPVSPVWCVFATSVCQPKCVPARVQQQRSVLLCASAGFTLSQRSISPQTINTLLIVFSPHLLCPYITPKTPVMRCCKDIEKKKKRRMGVIAAVKEAFEISPRSFAAAATAVRTILLESSWNRSCLWKRHKSISGSYDEPRHTKQKRGGEG